MLRCPIYLDSSTLSDLRHLFDEGLQQSDTLVLLASKGVLTRPWCQLELLYAKRNGIPIVPLFIEGSALCVEEMRGYVQNLSSELSESIP